MKRKRHIDSWFYADFCKEDGDISLNSSESEHLIRVFRVEQDDEIVISNGQGLVKTAIVRKIGKKEIEVSLKDDVLESPEKPKKSIAIGFLKGRDLEEVVETCCQMDLANIYILHTEFSQESRKSNHNKLMQRLETKSITGLKQAHKSWLTEIHEAQEFSSWLETYDGQVVLLDPDGHTKAPEESGDDQCVLIGPEGGLSPSEFSEAEKTISANGNSCYNMTLGNTRIRAKTAGVVALGKMC